VNLFNYLRISNDTSFLHSRAAKSNLTVDQALEAIVLDWQGSVIPGTSLADYGTNLDGFSRTYMHVRPPPQPTPAVSVPCVHGFLFWFRCVADWLL